jgi:hypothetical protein
MQRNPFLAAAVIVGVLAIRGVAQERSGPTHPDLQGVWTNATMTPLQRPAEAQGKTHFTPDEGKAYEEGFFARGRKTFGANADLQIDFNDDYVEASTLDRLRTSLLIDPPDGRLPPLVSAAQARAAARPARSFDDPETANLQERCLAWTAANSSTLTPPMIPAGLVPYYQFVQTDDYLMISAEWLHDARIIRIGGTHQSPLVKRWFGDSIGYWEGDTLVVDTVNFRPDTHYQGSGEQLHAVERFTRTDADTVRYVVTVDDPETWARGWTAEVLFRRSDARMFEFACHEGNQAIELFLRGARAEEARAR